MALLEKVMREEPAKSQLLSSYLQRLQKENGIASESPSPTPATSAQSISPREWSVLEGERENGPTTIVESVQWQNDRLWIEAKTNWRESIARTITIATLDLSTFQAQRLSLEQRNLPSPSRRFEIIGKDLFLTDQDAVLKYDATDESWLRFSVPGANTMNLWLVSNVLYLTGTEGSITRFDPRTGEIGLFASSRRRPAQTMLDDTSPYAVLDVFAGFAGSAFHRDQDFGV